MLLNKVNVERVFSSGSLGKAMLFEPHLRESHSRKITWNRKG